MFFALKLWLALTNKWQTRLAQIETASFFIFLKKEIVESGK